MRSSLGDIINSTVVYLGAGFARGYGGAAYAAFTSANASRTPAVFVGANDGMLHAFNASSADPAPPAVQNCLATSPAGRAPIAGPDRPCVRQRAPELRGRTPLPWARAQVGSAGTASDWKTVLVAGTGGGGHGVFALDVTDPGTSFGASKVMWEFKRSDDAAIGQVIGQPRLHEIQDQRQRRHRC